MEHQLDLFDALYEDFKFDTNKPLRVVELFSGIGDELVDGKPYHEIVGIAKDYIDGLGGFEKFAEWGLF